MKTVINTRIDAQLKVALQEMANQMGISLSSLVSAALTKVAKDRKLEMVAPKDEYLSAKYEKELLNDPDAKETVFVAKSDDDLKYFFKNL